VTLDHVNAISISLISLGDCRATVGATGSCGVRKPGLAVVKVAIAEGVEGYEQETTWLAGSNIHIGIARGNGGN
jgi:hypothetical protein